MFMLGFNEASFPQIETHYTGDNRKLERYGQKSAIDQEIDWSKDDWNLASLPGIVCH